VGAVKPGQALIVFRALMYFLTLFLPSRFSSHFWLINDASPQISTSPASRSLDYRSHCSYVRSCQWQAINFIVASATSSTTSLTSIPSTTGSATSSSTATTVATTDSASSKVPLRLLLQPIRLMRLHPLCETHICHRNHQLIKVPRHTRLPNLALIHILIPSSPILCGHHSTADTMGLLIRRPILHNLCKTELGPAPRAYRVVGLQLVSGVLALDLILSRWVFHPLLLKCKLICNHECKLSGRCL